MSNPHAVTDITAIKTKEELLARVKWLEGKTLSEISEEIQKSDPESRVLSKSAVGDLIQEGFLGIKKNSDAGPDILHLGVEVKTSPLKYTSDRRMLVVKEPLSLNMINYDELAITPDIKRSSLYRKNHFILFIVYIHDTELERSEYLVRHVFLWDMDSYIEMLEADYRLMVQLVNAGKAHPDFFGQKINHYQFLSNCPKHGGYFKNPACRTSRAKQPFSSEFAERRAFRFRTNFMTRIIADAIGIRPKKWKNGDKEAYFPVNTN